MDDIGEFIPTLPVGVIIPTGAILDKIQSKYEHLKDNVQCGLAGCRTPHKNGYVVGFCLTPDGEVQRALMGHVCGQQRFGDQWNQEVQRHEVELRRVETVTALKRFLEVSGPIEARLNPLISGLEARKEIRNVLKNKAGSFMQRCADACRDYNDTLAKVDHQTEQTTKYKLDGRLFFLQDIALTRAKMIINGIKIVRDIATKPDTTAMEINEKLSKLTNLSMWADAIEKESRDYIAALRSDNMTKAIACAYYDHEDKPIRMRGSILEEAGTFSNSWKIVADLSKLP